MEILVVFRHSQALTTPHTQRAHSKGRGPIQNTVISFKGLMLTALYLPHCPFSVEGSSV